MEIVQLNPFRIRKNLSRFNIFKVIVFLVLIYLYLPITIIQASTIVGQEVLFDIHVNDKPMKTVFEMIEKQSDYTFFYNTHLVNDQQKVSVDVSNQNLSSLLDKLFANTTYTYEIVDRKIIVSVRKQKTRQDKNLTGHVEDEYGEPIIGATVRILGSSQGTITDIDGNFSIANLESATLHISFVGYRDSRVEAKAGHLLRVVLQENSKLLSEVVVVGYSTQRKENLTGAVSSIDVSKTLDSRPIADVGRGLQGTTPGLSIVVPNGELGSDPMIKIRGQIGSIEGSSAPLILLDNVEIPSIQMVNPDDIESISVLKDAASSSIYGAKAAFGVILITSKKGSKQEMVNVSYSGSMSWQNIAKRMDMGGIHALEYSIDAMLRSPRNVGVTGGFIKISEEGLERAREWNSKYSGKIGVDDPYVYGRDWYVDNMGNRIGIRLFDPYDYMIEEWTPTMNHNLSVNGRSGKTTYNIAANYLDQTGMMKTAKEDDFKRWNASVKLSTEIGKFLVVRAGTLYSQRIKRFPYTTNSTTADPWLYLYRWGPNMPMGMDDEGNPLRSPVEEIRQANTGSMEWNYINYNIGATLKLLKGWNVDIDFTHSNEEYIEKKPGTRYTALNTWGGPVAKTDEAGNQLYVNENGEQVSADIAGAMPAYKFNLIEYTGHGANPDHVYQRRSNAKRNTLNIVSTYDWNLSNKHIFKFLAGLNLVKYQTDYIYAQKTDLVQIGNPQFDLAVGTQTNGGYFEWDAQLGYFGRINYSFEDKYLLEANVRYDATSKFPTGMKWRLFPSFSAGWRMSEEAWMEWTKPALSSFKWRASWGTIGDQTVPNNLYVSTLAVSESNWIGGNGKKAVSSTVPTVVANSITWQDITTLDVGMDARLFNGCFGITFDWYQRDTRNMIVSGGGVSLAFGADSPKGNYGSLRTRGWEVALDYTHSFDNGLSINVMGTLSDAKTQIVEYGDETSIDGWYAGKEYGEIWGYRTDRLYQNDDFVFNEDGTLKQIVVNGKTMNQLKDPNGVYQDYLQSGEFYFGPGDVKFVDLNHDGTLDDGSRTVNDHGDLEVIGNTTPQYEYGLRISADYKGFDCSVFLQGVGARQVWGTGFLAIPGFNSSDGAMPETFASDYWREDRTDAFYPRPYNLEAEGDRFNMVPQSKYLLNMAYARIKNITLGYTLPASWVKKVYIKKARAYLSLENFFTFDHLRGLPIDPETVSGYSMFDTTNYNSGRTGVGTPAFKSVAVGIQLNF